MIEIANKIIESIEFFELQEKCTGPDDPWEKVKEDFLYEAKRGNSNSNFWSLVRYYSGILECYIY